MKTKTTKTTTTLTPAQERAAKLEAAKLALAAPTKGAKLALPATVPSVGIKTATADEHAAILRQVKGAPRLSAAQRSSATTALKKANAEAALQQAGAKLVAELRDSKRIAAALTVPAAEKTARFAAVKAATPKPAPAKREKPAPTDNGHCPKCGRFNEVGHPNCLNAKACATRIETATNYIAHVLKQDMK